MSVQALSGAVASEPSCRGTSESANGTKLTCSMRYECPLLGSKRTLTNRLPTSILVVMREKSVLPGLLGPASLPSLATAVQHGRHTGKAMDMSDDELAAIVARAKRTIV